MILPEDCAPQVITTGIAGGFPTDARLYDRARELLVKDAKKRQISFSSSFFFEDLAAVCQLRCPNRSDVPQHHCREDGEHCDTGRVEDDCAVEACYESNLRFLDQTGRQFRRYSGCRPEAVAHRFARLFGKIIGHTVKHCAPIDGCCEAAEKGDAKRDP